MMVFNLVNSEDVGFLECPGSNIFGQLYVSRFDSTVREGSISVIAYNLLSEGRTGQLPSAQSCR